VQNNGVIGTLTNGGSIGGGNYGVRNSGSATISVLSNSGTITGSLIGLDNIGTSQIGLLDNTIGGLISSAGVSASGDGIYNGSGSTIGTVGNQGTIRGTGTSGNGIANYGSIGLLSNATGAAIAGGASQGGGIVNQATIGILTNSGSISGGATGAYSSSTGTIGTLSNSGHISGGTVGVQNVGQLGTLANTATGSISGGATGVRNIGTIGTLSNTGSIAGPGIRGVANVGSIGTLGNSGAINGDDTAIYNLGTIGALTNSGTISGPKAIVSSGSIGPITNSGAIFGNITISNQNVTIYGGTGSTFGTLAGGVIDIVSGNLMFGGGNNRLQDNIIVNGGNGTVTNADPLVLTGPQTITGSYVQTSAGTLQIDIAGTSAADYGSLSISGGATLDGGLALDLLNGFTLSSGESFDILDALQGITDEFDAVSFNGIACSSEAGGTWNCSGLDGLYFAEVISGGELTLNVAATATSTPEPGTLALLAAGIAGLGAARRWRPRGRAEQRSDAATQHRATTRTPPLTMREEEIDWGWSCWGPRRKKRRGSKRRNCRN
jgi:hypothetical protein